jgi:uncharacterized protein YdcH (DUF465 family)
VPAEVEALERPAEEVFYLRQRDAHFPSAKLAEEASTLDERVDDLQRHVEQLTELGSGKRRGC